MQGTCDVAASFPALNNTPFCIAELEPRLRMAIVIAATEKTLVRRLRCVEAVYGQHLRRLSSVTEDEHEILFGGVAPIVTQAEAFISRVGQLHVHAFVSLFLS